MQTRAERREQRRTNRRRMRKSGRSVLTIREVQIKRAERLDSNV